MGWLIVIAVLLLLLARVMWKIRMWAWRIGLKDPRERIEAEILWSRYKAGKRIR